MRLPNLDRDGWELDDGVERNRDAPQTFLIPSLEKRESVSPGDHAKLIFRIALDNPQEPETVERMWVLVRERVDGAYLGLLDNDPYGIDENDRLWSGVELAFEPRHVIDIAEGDSRTLELALARPRTPWPRH